MKWIEVVDRKKWRERMIPLLILFPCRLSPCVIQCPLLSGCRKVQFGSMCFYKLRMADSLRKTQQSYGSQEEKQTPLSPFFPVHNFNPFHGSPSPGFPPPRYGRIPLQPPAQMKFLPPPHIFRSFPAIPH